MTVRVSLVAFGLALAALTAGCGRNSDHIATFPARGQVLWEGTPVAGALVVLHPQSVADRAPLPARAETDQEGKFILGTYDSEDGVPAGEYRITVHWHRLQQDGGSFEPGPDVVPARYSDPVQTELKYSIVAGENQIPPLNLRR